MILEEIKLKDFRCFFGESSIRFSTDPEKNVTLIYAENGVGKTTILNALLWCFYGETTTRFEKKEDILNHDAKKVGRNLASVEVIFKHRDNEYIAKRFSGISAIHTDKRSFIVARVDNGSQIEMDAPDTFINSVIPKDMAAHFLFDGEHAEVFLGENNSSAIKSAVRDILGCSLIETAISDLSTLSNKFRKQIPNTGGSQRITELNNSIDTIAAQIESANSEIIKLKDQISSTNEQVRGIEDKLRNSAAAKEHQRRRDELGNELQKWRKRAKEYADEVQKWLGDNGRHIVSKRITEETFEFLEHQDHKGRIPSPYNEEFVKDVLSAKKCICGADLLPGSDEAKLVASLLEKAANQTVRDRITKVRARLSNLRTERAKAPALLFKAKERRAEANQEIESLEAKLGEIHEKLKNINLDDIDKRESKRAELRKELARANQAIGSIESNIVSSKQKKLEYEKEIDQLAQFSEESKIYSKRRNLCESIKGTLEVQLKEEENLARSVLRASIKKILASTSRKSLNLKMTDDYTISLINDDGIPLPRSSGENQLLGLSFTAALIEFAKVRANAQDYRLLPGTIAPLVLDSPFGQLDDSYRKTTATFIPKMARQVILLLSKSQASEEVLSALSEHINAEYLLIRHNKAPLDDRTVEIRNIKGKSYQLTHFDSSYDGTEILEIN